MYILAAVRSVNSPVVGVCTFFEILVFDSTATLPVDVDTIQITGPSGVLPYSKADFIWTDNLVVSNQFFHTVSGAPEAGLYTFSLTIGGDTQEDTKTQGAVSNIPIPVPLGPIGGQVGAGDVNFSWEAVDTTASANYGIQIYDTGAIEDTVVKSARVLDSLLHIENLSVGNYKWRVVVQDDSSVNWKLVDNRSHSLWSPFEVI